jgi:hypothetical protein
MVTQGRYDLVRTQVCVAEQQLVTPFRKTHCTADAGINSAENLGQKLAWAEEADQAELKSLFQRIPLPGNRNALPSLDGPLDRLRRNRNS